MFQFMFRMLMDKMKDPKSLFVMALFQKWYMIILVPTIGITYYFFKGLQESGIIKNVERFITSKLAELLVISQKCSPKLAKLQDFMDCLK